MQHLPIRAWLGVTVGLVTLAVWVNRDPNESHKRGFFGYILDILNLFPWW